MNKTTGWNLIVDVAECHNCNNCVVATKDELVDNDHPNYSAPHPAQGVGVMHMERHVRGQGHHLQVSHLPRMCQHCDNAPCVQAGRGAVRKRDDGIVIFDPQACRGRRDLVDACPYGAVIWNEAQQLPQTWFFDAHLLDAQWPEPRCVGVCPTGALQAVRASAEDMAERARCERLLPLRPDLATQPRVHYRNLHRVNRGFIAVSVITDGECAEGASATLSQQGQPIAHATSDAFGDLRFTDLLPGQYSLQVTHLAGRVDREIALGDEPLVIEALCIDA